MQTLQDMGSVISCDPVEGFGRGAMKEHFEVECLDNVTFASCSAGDCSCPSGYFWQGFTFMTEADEVGDYAHARRSSATSPP